MTVIIILQLIVLALMLLYFYFLTKNEIPTFFIPMLIGFIFVYLATAEKQNALYYVALSVLWFVIMIFNLLDRENDDENY